MDPEGFGGSGGLASKLRGMIATVLLLIGGVAIVVGTLFTWLELTVAGISFASGIFIKGAARGTELTYGIAALVAGAALALVGLFGLAFRRARWPNAAAILLALISGGVALYVLVTMESRFAEFASQIAETDDPAALRQRVEGFFAAGSLDVNPGTGLYVALAGSFVSLLGGAARIVGRRRRVPAPPATQRDEAEESRAEDQTAKSGAPTPTGSAFGFGEGQSPRTRKPRRSSKQ